MIAGNTLAGAPQASAPDPQPRLRTWRWRLAAAWHRPGALPMAIGALALLPAALLAGLAQPRWQHEAQAARQALQQRIAQMPAPQPASQPPRPAQRLLAALPAAAQSPQRLAELLALAQRHGLVVSSVQQAAAQRGDGIDSQPLTWRASGPYASLRAFAAEALQADPALVLDQLRLSRSDARSPLLDADLHWQLLQRADATLAVPPPAPGARP